MKIDISVRLCFFVNMYFSLAFEKILVWASKTTITILYHWSLAKRHLRRTCRDRGMRRTDKHMKTMQNNIFTYFWLFSHISAFECSPKLMLWQNDTRQNISSFWKATTCCYSHVNANETKNHNAQQYLLRGNKVSGLPRGAVWTGRASAMNERRLWRASHLCCSV